jgi:hypothetical protein
MKFTESKALTFKLGEAAIEFLPEWKELRQPDIDHEPSTEDAQPQSPDEAQYLVHNAIRASLFQTSQASMCQTHLSGP